MERLGSQSRSWRRAFSVRLVGTMCASSPVRTPSSPTFSELDGVLAAGDQHDHPVLPPL